MLRLSPFLLLLTIFTICPRVVLAQAPDDPDEVIRVETDVTNLPFTAMDKQKRFITTLREEDIRVFEDDVPQHLFTFQRETDRPLALALLIDVSESEERTLPAEKAAARSFIETVIQSRKDQAAVIPFTGSAFLEQPLTRDVLGIYRALERVEVAMPAYLGSGRAIGGIVTGPGTKRAPREGSTAIWDAIALTASEVLTPSVQSQSRRRAIILLTDGQDTSSVLEIDAAIERALSAETVIYAIGIGDSKYEGIDRGSLRRVAERTGGRAFFPKKEADLRQVFRDIERELRTQYLIAYSSTNKQRDGGYRQMRIDVINPELKKDQVTLRHRPGYFAKTLSK
jgi:VWFA-related protein